MQNRPLVNCIRNYTQDLSSVFFFCRSEKNYLYRRAEEVSVLCFLSYPFKYAKHFCLSHSTTSVNNPSGDNNDKNENIKAKNNNKNNNNGSDYKIKDNSDAFDFKIN